MPKKIPMRQCVGCREKKPKPELIRVVRSPQGEISLDFHGKKPGRGAYLCPNQDCLKRARKSKALGGPSACPFRTTSTPPWRPKWRVVVWMDSIPSLLGLALRAGRLAVGEEPVRGSLPGAQSLPAAAGQRRGGQHHPPGLSLQPVRKEHHLPPAPPDQGGAGRGPAGADLLRHGGPHRRGVCRGGGPAPGPKRPGSLRPPPGRRCPKRRPRRRNAGTRSIPPQGQGEAEIIPIVPSRIGLPVRREKSKQAALPAFPAGP